MAISTGQVWLNPAFAERVAVDTEGTISDRFGKSGDFEAGNYEKISTDQSVETETTARIST